MDFLKKALPFIGAAATGNIPALVGMAAKTVGEALGIDVEATPDAINKAVANATPEQMLALQQAEYNFKLEMQKAGYKYDIDKGTIELETIKAFVQDTDNARKAFSENEQVFWLGVVILVAFSIGMVAAMVGAYELLSGGIEIKDIGVVAAVFGFLGSIVGYLAANAQQVVSYFFGSSAGSKAKNDALAGAIAGLGQIKR